ncbi:hypothetical protein O181_015947 [Austropuccinia psidii MF-1]|uniref:Uncharacterized protein n=1 Tax=Austropuccinia psidii MF-1 TaxID=1389203 RepID=A0A9Q3GR81_9BASI|nr:hypothetical protein [Austropuccinia psidii MF-1]
MILFQYSPLERQTRSQARYQAILTPTKRVPLDGTPSVHQLRAHLCRGPVMEGEVPSSKEGGGPIRSRSFSEVVGAFPILSKTTSKALGEDGDEKYSDC